jgi:serine/threonine-protein kinase
MNLQTGAKIDQYTLLGKLGHGGMSDVFRAQDEQNRREVVLKFPHEDMMGDPATFERFQREVKIGTLLTHPNIQKLYELGGGKLSPYLVLEYVDGTTMREFLDKEGQLPVEKAILFGVQLAQALAYAHANHVVHRDMKPENVIVTPAGQAKVMDFGIAFVEGARRVTWGRLSSQVGTPDYMAPEQIKGNRGDERTDIYALGIMIYEFLAARPPYQGDNALAIMNQHVTANPPLLHRFNKEVPPALEEVVLKAIRRDATQRWQSMEALVEALQHLDSINVAELKAERQIAEGKGQSNPSSSSLDNPFGLPLWQVSLIIIMILLAIIAFGIVAQLLHH